MIKTMLVTMALGLSVLMIGASAAEAGQAKVLRNAKVHTGPGLQYATIGVLAAGTRVNLNHCQKSWCSVSQGPLQGWTAAPMLQPVHTGSVVITPPVIIHPPHHVWPHHVRPPHHLAPMVLPPHHRPPHHKPPHHKPMCKIAPGHPCP